MLIGAVFNFGKFSAIFFTTIYFPYIFLLSFWNLNYSILNYLILSQASQTFWFAFIFSLVFLFVLFYFDILYFLSSRSLIISLAICSLNLSLWNDFFTSDIYFIFRILFRSCYSDHIPGCAEILYLLTHFLLTNI